MNAERLVEMANDIAAYFQVEPDRTTAVEGMAMHLQRFWDPRMRAQIVSHLRGGGDGLLPLAREAVAELARRLDGTPPKPQGGGGAG
jgi:formate dehydrogenase subunit delta